MNNPVECLCCTVPGYRDNTIIFCDVCVKKILDNMRRKQAQEGEEENGRE